MESKALELMRQIEDYHWWFVGRRKIIAHVLRKCGLRKDANILEIGCGTGGNLEMLSTFGDVISVESDPNAAEMARKREITPVLDGHLPDGLPEFERKFDLIALFDVIEHVEEDGESLNNIRKFLNTGGRVILTVPAFNFLWSIHDEENHHFKRYRKGDIFELAMASNLKIDYITYFNFWLFAPVAAVRLFRKVIPYKESWKDMKKPPGPINSLLERLFSSERIAIGQVSLPFGISLMVTLSRDD